MTKQLDDKLIIRTTEIKNRLCLPPLVLANNSDDDGYVTDYAVEHYRTLAAGGFGLIIQEATCVSPDAKLGTRQIGLWSDDMIDGSRRIVDAVHEQGTVIFVQIHHAGAVGISDDPLCPSDCSAGYYGRTKRGRAMTVDEIKTAQRQFVDTAVRAYKAGYDGVELHGCHSYLISQFFNSRINVRTDEYGDGMNFVRPIIDGIRAATDDRFIIGIRLGGFEPALADGIAHAQALERAGIDFIDVSYGFESEATPECPDGLPYKDIIYAAGEIKKAVGVPVFAVNSICTPADADAVLAGTDVDMVDIGRSALVDPNWARKALNGETPGRCLHCSGCAWFSGSGKCPGRLLMERNAGR